MKPRIELRSAVKGTISIAAAASGLVLLAGCNIAAIERAHYEVTEVQSFKTAGAPSRVMMLEIVDASNTFTDDFWSAAMSNHGYPPRLRFVTDPADIEDGETIKPESRMVTVVNPEQSTMRGKLCSDPKSLPVDETADTITVRFGFCVGDKIISETRAHFNKAQFAEQVENNADTINYQLFPRHLRNNDDRYCSPFLPSC
ncbi:hypothetical protein UF64_11345 [Thalassospira sp. HJ]|uniref:hypothetical protein n=1 Tax=Thalassospira sp. HJ TaxID=1616823 RepID=UPI0005E3EDAC|nr:hypothetical protein [Thalassospira sp. HJ]KJE35235.1 hypothetical protein UF64_11345 [Thalassospira sp. HJ]